MNPTAEMRYAKAMALVGFYAREKIIQRVNTALNRPDLWSEGNVQLFHRSIKYEQSICTSYSSEG
jgi:hypothetical protein